MKQGDAKRPFASITLSPVSTQFADVIVPSITPISALNHCLPVPPIRVPFLISKSKPDNVYATLYFLFFFKD
jgi:hypothetical protein